jgi:penicillin-binding protein 2
MTTMPPPSKLKLGRQSKARSIGQPLRAIALMLLISLPLLGAIGSRLAYLQLVQGERNRELAENNRIRLIPKQPVRGNIFDRDGDILATSGLSHSVFIWPLSHTKPGWKQTVKYLSDILEMPESEIIQTIENEGHNATTLVRIARGLTPTQVIALQEYNRELVGVEVDIEPVRKYPNAEVAAHILGYTGELNAEELAKRRHLGYRLGDIVGQMGIESSQEEHLRGEWGGQQVEVDGAGRIVKILGEKEAKSGKDLHLTLDLDLQKAAETALGNRKGAIVAIDPNNGEVLAMVSRPTFDPNIFSGRISPEIWKELQSQGNPFVNRALRGFPPASTFKIVTAAAGMESGEFPSGVVLPTSPYLSVGGVRFHEWNRAGFGPAGYVKALAWSSNTFFGQIGKGVGEAVLVKWSRRFGFGEATGIELDSEASGLIADDTWKRNRLNWGWTVGDTVNMSIGQGFTQATPLQVAVMFAVPANSGDRVRPHIIKQPGDDRQFRESLDLEPATVDTLRQGLRQVVASGTGAALNVPSLPPVAGKSGTAEAPPGLPHAWFGAYAPNDNPEVVVVAFAEHSGGGGGSVAAPMVRQVLEAYFKDEESAGKEVRR